MKRVKLFFATALTATALVLGVSHSASADPTGTTFLFSASNFPGNVVGEEIPFGEETASASGMVINSHVESLPNGHDFLEIWFETASGGFLAGSSFSPSTFLVSGLNWGEGAPPAQAVGLLYISFDSNGVYQSLNPENGIAPIIPHPLTGQDTIVVDVDGEPASDIPFDVGAPLSLLLANLLTDNSTGNILSVNSMHLGFEVAHVPEPASLVTLAVGAVALCGVTRRRRRA
ncbi:MAG: PEP-CTERM sorting domain-containing protein [Planctomycetales bacterium]|nr:PEP-CTERM sorting domain-containing protein [Planctomycetales bacterium]